ncbi:MAG TPA: hypothetical protein VD970_16595 [Acetobacteraceae bacterium]|nr:hypothetical protein [Acetobacteraceae bacterium]
MGIWIAALAVTVLAPLLLAWPIRKLSAAEDRRALWMAMLIALPLQPLAFHALRLPLHHALEAGLGRGLLLNTLSLLYAPLTEEPAKWLVLLLPSVRRALATRNAIAFALATGVGFGIGEAWFIASYIARDPALAALPGWMFGGYLVERLQVVFLHGAFLLWFARALAAGRAPWTGGAIGMALHFACNLPIVLIALDPFALGRAAWTSIVSLWVTALAVGLLVAVQRLARRDRGAALFGTSTCPGCGTSYPRPLLLAVNLGPTRIERCPSCRRWHRVPARPGAAPS